MTAHTGNWRGPGPGRHGQVVEMQPTGFTPSLGCERDGEKQKLRNHSKVRLELWLGRLVGRRWERGGF